VPLYLLQERGGTRQIAQKRPVIAHPVPILENITFFIDLKFRNI
jgi:hypothetical protein